MTTEPDTLAGPGDTLPAPLDDAPHLRAAPRPGSAQCHRLWLTAGDRRRLGKLRDKLTAITGSQGSNSILLRAGISVLDQYADMILADRKKHPETRGKKELSLLWWVAAAARRAGGDEGR